MSVPESRPGAAHAADDLYRTHAAAVYRYALAVLGQPADAEDVTQTTFLNAFRSLERGVRPRKPASWLLTIASNVIKERFRTERSRATAELLDERVAGKVDDDETPTIGELMAALRRIPPLQRQAIVLREFEGRSYAEIAEILDVTTSALETLLFRARRSLADELDSGLSCMEAQFALSRAVDSRLGRKERRRLREHLEECAACTRFARVQHRHRRAFRGLALLPVPVSIGLFRGLEAPAAMAAVLPSTAATATTGASAAGGIFAGTVALKAAAVVTAATVAGGVGVVGAAEVERRHPPAAPPARAEAQKTPAVKVAPVVNGPGPGVAGARPDNGKVVRAGGRRVGATVTPPGKARRATPALPAATPVRSPSTGPRGGPPWGRPARPVGRSARADAKAGNVRRRPAPPPKAKQTPPVDARASRPVNAKPRDVKPEPGVTPIARAKGPREKPQPVVPPAAERPMPPRDTARVGEGGRKPR